MKAREKLGFAKKLRRYLKDPSVALWRKLAGVGAAAYVVFPFDVVPDVLPLVGWLDDAGVLSAAAMFMIREVRRHTARVDAAPPSAPERPGEDDGAR